MYNSTSTATRQPLQPQVSTASPAQGSLGVRVHKVVRCVLRDRGLGRLRAFGLISVSIVGYGSR